MPLPEYILERLASARIRPEDVEERFVLGSGPGGQKINKSSSTVWLLHRPTGVQARCQNQRSQTANRHAAWLELCEKLAARARSAADEAIRLREAARRRTRQKSRGQKVIMIESKKRRARRKSHRARVDISSS